MVSGDARAWTEMQLLLWPDHPRAELERNADEFFAGRSSYCTIAFIAVDSDGAPLGFLELNLRSVAEGCESSPVPHVEGWYVKKSARRRGVGRELMRAAEEWALANGYSEMTSDTTEAYPLSVLAHQGNGFAIVERLIAFHKRLAPR